MIKISIELIPLGIYYNQAKTLGVIKICNKSGHPDHPKKGNYKVDFYDKAGKKFKTVRVDNWSRLSNSIWKLLKTVFERY